MTESFPLPCVAALIPCEVDGQLGVTPQGRRGPGTGVQDGLELPADKRRECGDVFDALDGEVREETGVVLTRVLGKLETTPEEHP